MMKWLAIWIAVVVLEHIIYVAIGKGYFAHKSPRWAAGCVMISLIVSAAVLMLLANWKIWLLPALITPYRILNVARFMKYRMQQGRLSSLSLRAHAWLVLVQVLLGCLGLIGYHLPVTHIAGIFVSLQLFVVLILLRSTTQTWEFAGYPKHDKHYTDRELPSVSVLVPARDETESLQACLVSLVASDYPKLEILVLDDCSLDRRTPEIIRGFAHDGVRFVQGMVPEENWVAKNHASEQLRKEASGQVLLFCSADVELEPQTIRSMVEVMQSSNKDMISVLPSKQPGHRRGVALLEPMRYYWELCLPRRLFKRPPVLSTCWMIRATTLEEYGGFEGLRQSLAPETHFARRAVIADRYAFLRSSGSMVVYNTKVPQSQYDTTIRLRYPQLHRRLELVAITSIFELIFLVGPFVGVLLSPLLPHSMAYILAWLAVVAATELIYYFVSVETRLNSTLLSLLTAPLAILVDVYMLHLSFLRYEFGEVSWKGRNVCIPVMRVEPAMPKLPDLKS